MSSFCSFSGGFRNFEENFPEFCEGQEDKTVEKDILGLSSLKISEDSAYGTCDSENGDLDSPTSNVPVKVIPYLYLGNAKNSADLSVLKDHGITYILNVTPNVPNKFENDSTFKYMKIPISDHLSQNLSQFFPEAIAFIGKLVRIFYRNFVQKLHFCSHMVHVVNWHGSLAL